MSIYLYKCIVHYVYSQDYTFIWFGKDPDAGKDWRQKKWVAEDELVVWHHRLNGHEFEQALGIDDGQESLACYSPWGRKELDMTEPLNWTDVFIECMSHIILNSVLSEQ